MLYAFFFSPIHATCPAPLIYTEFLAFIILIAVFFSTVLLHEQPEDPWMNILYIVFSVIRKLKNHADQCWCTSSEPIRQQRNYRPLQTEPWQTWVKPKYKQ
jgi:hypothetical protein